MEALDSLVKIKELIELSHEIFDSVRVLGKISGDS